MVNGVEFEDGEVLPADAVVVGAGVLPNTRFVEGLSLDTWAALATVVKLRPSLHRSNCEGPSRLQNRVEIWLNELKRTAGQLLEAVFMFFHIFSHSTG